MDTDEFLPALTVRAGPWWLAVPTRCIHVLHGYLRHPSPTPLPDSPPWLTGLMEGPAGLTPVIHLARLGGAAEERPDRRHRLLVCITHPPLALRLEEARGIVRLRRDPTDAAQPPSRLAPYLEAGYRLDGRSWWVLNPERLARLPGLSRET